MGLGLRYCDFGRHTFVSTPRVMHSIQIRGLLVLNKHRLVKPADIGMQVWQFDVGLIIVNLTSFIFFNDVKRNFCVGIHLP